VSLDKDLTELDAESNLEIAELRKALQRAQKDLQKAKQRTDELVEATIQSCHDAILAQDKSLPITAPITDKRRTKSEVALWHMTDWQGAKRTVSYDSKVMRKRVLKFVQKAVRITDIQRADHPVRDLTIMFGGDMVEGLFNFPTQPFEIDATLFEQYVTVSQLLVDVVRYALTNYEKVTVVAEWGNHGRIGSKRDNVPRSDNTKIIIR
jgi:hypothetical protein